MTISIIIAVKACCENLKECVSNCLELDWQNYEIIILPDREFPKEGVFSSEKVRILPTGNVTPPKKRDMGAVFAKGEIMAFLDDDAYPVKDWLSNAIDIFKQDENIACVCGPAVTPDSDSVLQKASGLVYESILVSGNHIFRYTPKRRRDVSDFPSCNLLIRKDIFQAAGGFDKPFWPGEDTFLCLNVLNLGKRIAYDPDVLVFHHRRSLFTSHLNQIRNYGLHRGYFAKRYPKTSLRIEYFIPSLFIMWNIAGILLSWYSPAYKNVYFLSLKLYFLLMLINSLILSIKGKESLSARIRLFFLVISGIILTHITYGAYFIIGLFAKRMPEE
jgi:GT2 family glycosyltransferase